jgi:trehalose/maltose transport system permease protein
MRSAGPQFPKRPQIPDRRVVEDSGSRGRLLGLRTELASPEQRTAYLMVLPLVLIISVVAFYPVVDAISLSFREVRLGQELGWVGLRNYEVMLLDPAFIEALSNTAIFTIASVALECALGLGIALALNQYFVGRGPIRAIALVPWVFPTVISAVMWRLMYQDQIGIVNYLATRIGLVSEPILSNEGSTMVAAIVVDVWKTTPFVALLLLAGLQVIPADLYEASMVDGASALQRFTRITLPLLKPALLVAMLFRTLDAWRVYDLFWAMSDRQLESLSTYVYKSVRISQLNFSLGNAAGVFVFVSSLVIAIAFIGLLGRRATD